MEQENNNYFQQVRNNFSIYVFINLIKLYFLGTTQEDVKEPTIYLHKLEQLKLCNLSYIREYEQKFRKYAILARIDRTPEYLNKYILKIQGLIGLRLWNEFSTFEFSLYRCYNRICKKLIRKRMCKYRTKNPNKETRYKSTIL